MIILNIKLHFICKRHPNCNYTINISKASLWQDSCFLIKVWFSSPGLAWWIRIMSFKKVFIEPRERWHLATGYRTKEKPTNDNRKTQNHQTPVRLLVKNEFIGAKHAKPDCELLCLLFCICFLLQSSNGQKQYVWPACLNSFNVSITPGNNIFTW